MNLFAHWLKISFWLTLILLITFNRQPILKEKEQSLYFIAQYVKWQSSSEPLYFCVVGSGIDVNELEAIISGKKLNGRPLKAKKISGNPAGESCNILFSNTKSAGQEILTVNDDSGFAQAGGMVEFTNTAGNQFEINKTAAEKAGIRFDARLLKQAGKVY